MSSTYQRYIEDILVECLKDNLVVYDSLSTKNRPTTRLFYEMKRIFKIKFNHTLKGFVVFRWYPIITEITIEMNEEWEYTQGVPVTLIEDKSMEEGICDFLQKNKYQQPKGKPNILIGGDTGINLERQNFILGAF